ncbi:IS66 family insertion sequence element accessory protein TnpB [Hoeflea sp.]|uniref:IS66 family insertion sequence element accessory protein TnpB n=1 Tax=Hoeflea sp. TaxID=1940281 RepID=UPI003B01BA0D
MILTGEKIRVWLATRPVDFRKGHDGLSAVVQTVLGHDPYSGAVFAFRSRRGDRMKILVWDRTGLVMVYKRLEGGGFQWPRPSDGVIGLSPAQFSALFEGLDWKAVRAVRRPRPRQAA